MYVCDYEYRQYIYVLICIKLSLKYLFVLQPGVLWDSLSNHDFDLALIFFQLCIQTIYILHRHCHAKGPCKGQRVGYWLLAALSPPKIYNCAHGNPQLICRHLFVKFQDGKILTRSWEIHKKDRVLIFVCLFGCGNLSNGKGGIEKHLLKCEQNNCVSPIILTPGQ